ncbi:hypothetical protein B0J12DRAFT_756387 [Macrophomina phaseolina]|uniref:Uncharacterized protein n=1 Tax=Macrophomina phaseolina TaxID=35725 RepID=A0ABQ8G702_9PEZI|nr:hypothetical protein B0J12DRAFT_756387 [Macrophomina phaseolina]
MGKKPTEREPTEIRALNFISKIENYFRRRDDTYSIQRRVDGKLFLVARRKKDSSDTSTMPSSSHQERPFHHRDAGRDREGHRRHRHREDEDGQPLGGREHRHRRYRDEQDESSRRHGHGERGERHHRHRHRRHRQHAPAAVAALYERPTEERSRRRHRHRSRRRSASEASAASPTPVLRTPVYFSPVMRGGGHQAASSTTLPTYSEAMSPTAPADPMQGLNSGLADMTLGRDSDSISTKSSRPADNASSTHRLSVASSVSTSSSSDYHVDPPDSPPSAPSVPVGGRQMLIEANRRLRHHSDGELSGILDLYDYAWEAEEDGGWF